MIILQANKIERSFSGDVLFDNISLQVDERDRIALVGRNGAGKSTLLKILVGEEAPTSGEINTKRDLHLSYLAQDSRFESEATIYDEMLAVFDDLRKDEVQLRQMEEQMGHLDGPALEKLMTDYDRLSERFRLAGGFQYESDIKAILNGFKFDSSMWDMKISELSGGQNTRLALARMLLQKPELLVLDEPTNHLDIDTIAWLENYLVNYQGALIIVSHDRYFLDKVATVTLDLNPHSLDRYVGNYSAFMDLKAEKLATEAKNFEKQQKEIAKLEDFVQRNIVRASTTKRAQARRKQLEKMERLEKPSASQKSAHMTFHSEKVSGNVVLTVEDAAIGYDGHVLSEPINLELNKLDAIAIVGPNGIGKTTLIKSIVGQIPFLKGQSKYGANVETGYYDQTQSHLTNSNTVLDELWNDFATTPELEIRNRLGAFLFSGDDVKKSVGMLSGGERARLLLAKLSMQNNNFLVLDEPTNHLDIDSKEVLEDALINFDGSLLFVSHDRYFINRIATKVLEISENGSTLYLGDYDYYLEKKAELEWLAQEANATPEVFPEETISKGAMDYQAQKENQKEYRKLARRIEVIENALEEIEQQESTVTSQMSATNDVTELTRLQSDLDRLLKTQEDLMEEWESLSETLAHFESN
ncbi:ABC-F family ATP-binding cassette domain-containing protein [Streptococcus hyovaginalis]